MLPNADKETVQLAGEQVYQAINCITYYLHTAMCLDELVKL